MVGTLLTGNIPTVVIVLHTVVVVLHVARVGQMRCVNRQIEYALGEAAKPCWKRSGATAHPPKPDA
jgi:hypothetical protein